MLAVQERLTCWFPAVAFRPVGTEGTDTVGESPPEGDVPPQDNANDKAKTVKTAVTGVHKPVSRWIPMGKC